MDWRPASITRGHRPYSCGGQALAHAIDELRRHVEVRLTKLREGRFKIEQPTPMRLGEDAERAGHQQMPPFGLGAAGVLIEQKTFSSERKGERDGRAFTGIEKS
jgi:hypothetical protein